MVHSLTIFLVLAGALTFAAQSQQSDVPTFEVTSVERHVSVDADRHVPRLDTLRAQSVTQSSVAAATFDVASVKVQPPLNRIGTSVQDSLARTPQMTFWGDRFRAVNATAAWLILGAHGDEYRLREQLLGGPEWLDEERFEIDAIVRGVAPPSALDSTPPAVVLEMLRSLLDTRFTLRVRSEMREGPVYALVRARRDGRLGAGISVSARDCSQIADVRNGERIPRRECFPQWGSDRYRRPGQPMERFVRSIERRVGTPVINETGLSGPVDLEIPLSETGHFTALDRIGADSGLFTALEEVMGLKLESRRAPIPVLVVEHIERPTEN
jgi:uncharacterized protein (TIGR03435 family)